MPKEYKLDLVSFLCQKQHKCCVLDVQKEWANAQKVAGYIGTNGISNQPIATFIGWSNIPFVCIHIFILVVVRLLDTHEELWPLSCYGPDKDSTIFVVISLQRICGYLALREKMAIECENLYTVVTSLWSIRWRR